MFLTNPSLENAIPSASSPRQLKHKILDFEAPGEIYFVTDLSRSTEILLEMLYRYTTYTTRKKIAPKCLTVEFFKFNQSKSPNKLTLVDVIDCSYQKIVKEVIIII